MFGLNPSHSRQPGRGFIPWQPMLLLLGVLLFACGKKEQHAQQTLTYSLETASLVSHATAGLITAAEPIRVRFVAPVIPRQQIGQPVPQPVFTFQPAIAGQAAWEDERTLVFQPAGLLPQRQQYRGSLDIAALLPQQRQATPLELQFEVAPRELLRVDADFEPVASDDPSRVTLSGTVTFTANAELDDLRKAARLASGRQRLSLNWRPGGDGRSFNFESEPIQRGESARRFTLQIAAEPLAISAPFDQNFELPPRSELQVQAVNTTERGTTPHIEIVFSDAIDSRQNLAGFVTVTEDGATRELQVKAQGKKLFVSGALAFGRHYELTINPGIRSRWGTVLAQPHNQTVEFADLKPQMQFVSDGVFLPDANQRRLRFRTMNLRQVRLQIKQVFESNLGQFLQTERLHSLKGRSEPFNDYFVQRVGVEVITDSLLIGDTRNQWLQHELDLRKLIGSNDRGLYLVELRFEHSDMLYGDPDQMRPENRRRNWSWGDDYYSNPYSPGYLYQNGQIHKPLILSDIGLIAKQGRDRHLVFARRIADATPLRDVAITLRSYQNQIIARQNTDANGRAEFARLQGEVFLIEGEKDGQRSVLKLNEMAWNLSSFDTGGQDTPAGGTRAFLYTERGVYRPGDEINLAAIVRNENGTFPDNHPVTLKLYNPRNQPVHEQTLRSATVGFYAFTLRTSDDDPTGNWRAELLAGTQTFSRTIKIETVVPNKLKVRIEPEKSPLAADDRTLRLNLQADYLFGAPGAGLQASVEMTILSAEKRFDAFPNFSFSNEAVDFKPIQSVLFSGQLDANGRAVITQALPALAGAPSALKAVLTAEVLDRGGRPNRQSLLLPIEPYRVYAGIQKPELDYGYTRTGTPLRLPVVAVNPGGKAVAGRTLTYRIYRSVANWWWEYDNFDEFRLRFKSDRNAELIDNGTLISSAAQVPLTFTPENRGLYLIEVQEGSSGHSAAFFLNAYPWGELPAGGQDAGTLALKSDKASYRPGEQALISFPVPERGMALISVEAENQVLQSEWRQLDGSTNELFVPIRTTAAMLPNAYVSVAVVQPHAQAENDRPIRLYGVLPLQVEDPATRLPLTLTLPDILAPKQPFDVTVQTGDGKPAQFTLAVVDEGLLDLTAFKTPDPWQVFYSKRRLGVKTFDLYAYVIGANRGDVFRTFAIGGDMLADGIDGDAIERRRRFEPVSLFRGPLKTDRNGRATVRFEMPNYVGSVRAMVIAADGSRYGHADKTVPVKSDLMLSATLPRVLGPEDRITVPVTVFGMREGLGDVRVAIAAEGPVALAGERERVVNFSKVGEQEVFFELQARPAVGDARITITATAGSHRAEDVTNLQIRPSSPRIFGSDARELQPGNSLTLAVPEAGIPGSNHARISIRRRPFGNFDNRLNWLVQYPYGCIEQVTSAVFPQLTLKTLLRESDDPALAEKQIDANIDAGIGQLSRFQLPSGAFAYWPGSREMSAWGTAYGGHFLIEARQQGYHVPDNLLQPWLRHQQSQALLTRDNLTVRVYRVYLLALAGEPALGAMNVLKENNLQDMRDVEKWLLAAAYKHAGATRVADEIATNAGLDVRDYSEFAGTYGSTLRDKGMLLDALVQMERMQAADNLARELAQALASQTWYSTQTTGYMLLAMGKYIQALDRGAGDKPRLAGQLRLPGDRRIDFDTRQFGYQLDLHSAIGKEIELVLDSKSTVSRAFVTLEWDGVPLRSDAGDESQGLRLQVSWRDENGAAIDPASIRQGSSFWGHFRVQKSEAALSIEEVALEQVLPAGWEIENLRLSGDLLPNWMRDYTLNREEYVDFRDDRVIWFFDLPHRTETLDFVVKLNAVTVGSFALAPATVEAMYNREFRARQAGGLVAVTAR